MLAERYNTIEFEFKKRYAASLGSTYFGNRMLPPPHLPFTSLILLHIKLNVNRCVAKQFYYKQDNNINAEEAFS